MFSCTYYFCIRYAVPSKIPLCASWSRGFATRQTGCECVPGSYWTNKPANNNNWFYSLSLIFLSNGTKKQTEQSTYIFFFILIFLPLPFLFLHCNIENRQQYIHSLNKWPITISQKEYENPSFSLFFIPIITNPAIISSYIFLSD